MATKIQPRTSWGAKPPKRKLNLRATQPDEKWLHHTAGYVQIANNKQLPPKGQTWASVVRLIQDQHRRQGWDDIGYSWLIDPDGGIWEGRGYNIVGSHTHGRNSRSHGICLIGNFEIYTPTPAAIDALKWLLSHGVASRWWPTKTITGPHGNAPGAKTVCCGKHLIAKIPDINQGGPTATTQPTKVPAMDENKNEKELQALVASEAETDPAMNISVDGDIGPKTVAGVRALVAQLNRYRDGYQGSIAKRQDELTAHRLELETARATIDNLKASPPPTLPPTQLDPITAEDAELGYLVREALELFTTQNTTE